MQGMDEEEMRILFIHPCGTHVVKSYDMGPSRFTLRIFIALKIHRLGQV
jgi:hypothetical protein